MMTIGIILWNDNLWLLSLHILISKLLIPKFIVSSTGLTAIFWLIRFYVSYNLKLFLRLLS